MKKFLFALLALSLATAFAVAQTPKNFHIKGVVVDSTTLKPICYATVVLKDSSTIVKAVATDANGRFNIKYSKTGKYNVMLTYTGYTTVNKEIELTDNATTIDMGEVALSEGMNIGEVVVVGRLVTTDLDKTVYNTSADPETPALTALEMMRKVPMLSVDGQDNVLLNGESKYKILVNGKNNTMMNKNYKEVLRSMPASSIQKIEVITNPPSKYDADGITGLINIVTERKTNDAYNGSVGFGGDDRGNIDVSAYLAMSLGKLTLSVNGSRGEYNNPGSTSMSQTDYSSVGGVEPKYKSQKADGRGDGTGNFSNMSFDASYEIDTLNLISISMWGYRSKGDNTQATSVEFFDASNQLIKAYDIEGKTKYSTSSASGNIDWQRSFKKPEKTL